MTTHAVGMVVVAGELLIVGQRTSFFSLQIYLQLVVLETKQLLILFQLSSMYNKIAHYARKHACGVHPPNLMSLK